MKHNGINITAIPNSNGELAYISKNDTSFDSFEKLKEITNYLDKYKKYSNYGITAVADNVIKDSISEKDFDKILDLIERFVHLATFHQTALNNKLRIEQHGYIKVDDIKDAGLDEFSYQEMDFIAKELKKIKEKIR